jgi:hypothetical protein
LPNVAAYLIEMPLAASCVVAIAPLRASRDTKECFFMSPQKDAQTIEPVFLPIPATSEFLSLSPASIYRLIGLGRLQAVKAGGRTLIVMQSARDYAASLPPAKIKRQVNRMRPV